MLQEFPSSAVKKSQRAVEQEKPRISLKKVESKAEREPQDQKKQAQSRRAYDSNKLQQ